MSLMIAGATYERNRDCVRVIFRNSVNNKSSHCFFYIPSCRSENYLRGLIDYVRRKLA